LGPCPCCLCKISIGGVGKGLQKVASLQLCGVSLIILLTLAFASIWSNLWLVFYGSDRRPNLRRRWRYGRVPGTI
jgi:hypothetical protein